MVQKDVRRYYNLVVEGGWTDGGYLLPAGHGAGIGCGWRNNKQARRKMNGNTVRW